MNRIINELSVILRQFEAVLPSLFSRHPFPPGKNHQVHLIIHQLINLFLENFAILINSSCDPAAASKSIKEPFSIKDLIGDGFFFAVPIFRRSLEVRKLRKIGVPYKGGPEGFKIILKKNNILVCSNCGHYHEQGVLCPTCYKKVMDETEEIKKKIESKLKLNPIDADVVVLYEGEQQKEPAEFWNGRRIIEMEKPRPMWFSRNLMQRTTQGNADTTEVEEVTTINLKPSKLG